VIQNSNITCQEKHLGQFQDFAILEFNKARKTTRFTNNKSGIDDGEMSSHDLDNAPER
jgi:hypothetical protein